jgi:hypothetical protein
MIKRYFQSAIGSVKTYFFSNTAGVETNITKVFSVVIHGRPSANVTLLVTGYSFTAANDMFEIDSNPKGLGDTAIIALNSSGTATVSILIGFSGATPAGEVAQVDIQISALSSGRIGSPNTLSFIKTTT